MRPTRNQTCGNPNGFPTDLRFWLQENRSNIHFSPVWFSTIWDLTFEMNETKVCIGTDLHSCRTVLVSVSLNHLALLIQFLRKHFDARVEFVQASCNHPLSLYFLPTGYKKVERFGFSPGQFSSECYYFSDCDWKLSWRIKHKMYHFKSPFNVGIDTLSAAEAPISKR